MRILLNTDALGYGGAETHILELARGLYKDGHSVTVAAPNGHLVSALPHGVDFAELPQYGRTPLKLLRSTLALARLLRRRDFDLVHAHARLPALVAHRVARHEGLPLVVTAHAKFSMRQPQRGLSKWGLRTIAVSEDIKDHLIRTCHLYPDHIHVIPNGIDTVRFAPADRPGDGIRRIVFVSRLDNDCAHVAELLCRLAGRLGAKYPDVRIIIVGGGNAFESIHTLAEIMNVACDRELIGCTGARDDIENILSISDIFVGVSRALLEAAACGLPCIIAGNEGYDGILDPSAPDPSSNFCGRGGRLPDAELLFSDLCRLLDMSPEERHELGQASREYVLAEHSAKHSVEDTVRVYREAVAWHRLQSANKGGKRRRSKYGRYNDSTRGTGKGKRVRRVVVCGYCGYENLGDDAMLDQLLSGLCNSQRRTSVTVMSRHPKRDRKRFGVRCINRKNPFAVLGALIEADELILGGGTLLQNSTSRGSLAYYMAVAKLGLAAGCRLELFSAGLGPIIGERAGRRVGRLLRRARAIGLREPHSLDICRSLGVSMSRARLYADAAILTEPAPSGRVDRILSELPGGVRGGKYFAVSLRSISASGAELCRDRRYIARIAAALDGIADVCSAEPILILLSPQDRKISELVARHMEHHAGLLCGLTPTEVVGLLGRCEVAVGMRLHLLVFACAAGCPSVGLGNDPRLAAFSEYAGLPSPTDVMLTSPGRLISEAAMMATLITSDKATSISSNIAHMKELAQEQITF